MVERILTVEEDETWGAIRFRFDQHRLAVEGAAAVGVTALLAGETAPTL